MVPGKGDRGRGARWATRGAGRSGGDGRPPRPAGQVPGRWGREGQLTGFRWPEGWECERCGCATCPPGAGAPGGARGAPATSRRRPGPATRHPETRLRRRSRAMWLLAGSKGGASAPGLAAQVGVSENVATLVPGRPRGAMARPGCLRRAVGRGRGRGGRLPRRRARQDEEARAGAVHGHAADARGERARLGRRSPGVVPPRSRRGPRRVPELGDGAGIAMVEFGEGPCREPSPLLAVHVVFLPVPSWSKIPTAVPTTFVYIIIDKRIASVIHPNAFQM